MFCLSVCGGSKSDLLLFACWKWLLEVSIFPQQSCCSCLAYTMACVGVSCCPSVLCDGTAGCCYQPTGPSVSHTNERITLAGPAVFMCVYGKVCMHECSQITQICQQSTLLNLKHTHCAVVSHKPGLYLTSFFLLLSPHSPPHSFQLFPLSYILLLFSLPPCLLLAPFLLLTSCQPHPFSFSLVIPPALLLLSRPSWGVQ